MSANVEEHKPGATGEVRTGIVLRNQLNPKPVQYYAIDSLAIFEGDIILGTVAQMDQLAKAMPAIVGKDQFRWPDAVIPFQIDMSLPQQTQRRISQAIQHWEENTVIRFRARNPNDVDFVTFRNSNEFQLSKATPALAEFGGRLHMVHLGDSSNDIWWSTYDGTNWTENRKIPDQKSKATPALAAFGNRLHMVHLGDSSNNIWWSWFEGDSWFPNLKIPNQQSKAAPALAAFGGRLHMVHLGDSSNEIWYSTSDGTNWRPNVRIPRQKSKATPALAAFAGRLYLVHLGDQSNAIWYSWYIP